MTTTAMLASHLDDEGARARRDRHGPAVEVVSGLDDVEAAWRALEAEAVMSPYGRFDWVAAHQGSLPEGARETRVAILRGSDGEIDLLLPVQIERRGSLTVAVAIGGKHSNYNLPLMRRDFAARLTPERATRVLNDIGRVLGVDLLSLPNVPVGWDGWRNPFAAKGQPSASDAWALRLVPDGEAALVRSMSSDARKKMRNKARALAKVAPVGVLRPRDAAEVERVFEAYFRQKASRFAELGITDPFADLGTQEFLRRAAIAGLAEDRPAIELHALTVDDEIVAVLGGASDGRRFSGMILSFQAGPLERYSLGEMLVTNVVRDLGARGHAVFDLGVGDARYKRSVCDEVEALVDVVVPFSLRGRILASRGALLRGVKRRLKADPRAMAILSRLRKLRARPQG